MRRSTLTVKKHSNRFAFAGLELAWAIGCGGTSGGSADSALPPPPEAAAQEASGPALPYCTDKSAHSGVTDLSGTWVARLVGSQNVKAPGVGIFQVRSVYYLLLDVSQYGTEVVVDGRYCDRTEIDPPTSVAPVLIPDAWGHLESPVHRTGVFAAGSDGIPVLSLSSKVENGGVEVFGATLANPDTDRLPTDISDVRLADIDSDGHPGLTVCLGGLMQGSCLYTVQRQSTAITAIPVASDRVEGALAFSSSQNVLASNSTNVVALYQSSTILPDPTPCNSSFAMVRISAGAASVDAGAVDAAGVDGGSAVDGGGAVGCAWVRDHEANLFPAP